MTLLSNSERSANTFYFTASENSQTTPLLQGARNLDPNPARGGGSIRTEDGVSLASDTSPFSALREQTKPVGSDQISWYIVQEGDTLSQVAGLFDVSVNTIVWANELNSNTDIHPGETLLILPISGVQHVVEKGDTLKSIAKTYGGDIDEIISYNNLTDDGTLTVGETVTVPGGAVADAYVAPAVTDTKVATAPSKSVSGYFIHPVPGAVRTQGIHGYNAVDYGAPVGTPVRAAAGGSVILSRAGGGWNGGYGNYVVVDHPNGTQTLYAHLSKNAVWQGQRVVAGQVIGYVGNTGRSTGPHLHFEVRGATNPF